MEKEVNVNIQSDKANNGFGIASLVMGVLLVFMFWIPFLGGLLALIGIVLGIVGITAASKGGSGKGMAIAGLALCVLFGIAAAACGAIAMASLSAINETSGIMSTVGSGEIQDKERVSTESVSAAKLVYEYDANPAKAAVKYDGKCITIHGVVKRIGVYDGRSAVTINGDSGTWGEDVSCWFPKSALNDIAEISEGNLVSIEGMAEIGSSLSPLTLRQCKLIK